jgi:hypothetical protein
MLGKFQPVLLGGLLIGVLSALPFISALNGCCCLWVIVGGVLTTYLLQERSPVAVTAGDSAVAGLQAGIVGAIVAGLIGVVLMSVMGNPADSFDQMPRGDLPPQFTQILERFRDMPASFWYIGSFVVYLVIFPIFSVIGALLGVAIFKRNPPPPPPGTVEILPPE